MKWIGLTGGIASGKSTVAKMLRDFGLPVVDADELARKVVEKGSVGLQKVIDHFGVEVLTLDGQLDRSKLGQIVFKNKDKLILLESLLHPEIQRLKTEERLRLEREGATVAFYDVPLLFEKSLQDEFDATLLVYCDPELQLSRLMSRNSISEERAKEMLSQQMPLDEKKLHSDFIIMNNADLLQLRSNLKQVLNELDII